MSETLLLQNERLLTPRELGGLVLDAYDAALEVDPRLAEMAIVPLAAKGKNAHALALAVPKWWRRGGDAHQIHLRLDDPAATFQTVKEMIHRSPTSYRIISQRIGIGFEDLAPPVAYVFGVLHEMGHVSQYFDHEAEPRAFNQAVAAERRSLPYCYAPPSALAQNDSAERACLDATWDVVQARTGATDVNQLIEMQSIGYRNMPTEASADYFAAEVFADNPQLMDFLLEQ